MKFVSSFLLAATALAAGVLADSEEFFFLGLRTATKFHFSAIYAHDHALKVSYQGGPKGDALSAVITDSGKLKLSDGTFAVVTPDGPVVEGSEDQASAGFAIANGYLTYSGNSAFVPVANGDTYDLSVKPTSASPEIAIGISAQSKDTPGGVAADFPPSS
ncbi:ABR026Cp [Eremothecium gossypii ATCC 10895]|uniref:ABR026Cp n=1 Tax=Eremothecium gossypii (strain ATCC 10895 / CBS 109.51 / FGSC 9923 / NRRL Y-1056) TaxID=284811 RepID=Q75DJ6_EREGS|nr:ABR026Cp [Eremothecium gossypii ATCC 10895]AAS50796.1 ABR026Cp [Eremothecium gossypii ATCC 10895]AEY95085.1 FABR026Cp [Eremothecium gossypii FDAG1]